MNKVSRLLDASQTVRLATGMVDEGIRNGNRLKPAVRMMPLSASAVYTATITKRPIQHVR